MTETSADRNGTLRVPTPLRPHVYVPAASAAQRSSDLRRMLATADVLAGALAGLIAAASSGEVPLMAFTLVAAWPVTAFVCGLYAFDDLDVTLSLLALIKLESKGPALFVHRRSGRGGSFFNLYTRGFEHAR